ncbi:hypothetical protein RJT34_08349 [Clitoria ternatea]|uniref:Pentatricopeptide repeat-containing protein-mitochondrial domain-containing protein n=1 Tax=Clitoria ternatea TaxID=43366 RepID=A0AAN9K7L8_CLITE
MTFTYFLSWLLEKHVSFSRSSGLQLLNLSRTSPHSPLYILHLKSPSFLWHAIPSSISTSAPNIWSNFPLNVDTLLLHYFTSYSTYTLLYEAIINAYVHSQSPDQAVNFLHQMIHNGHLPRSNTFNNILILLIRSNSFYKAWRIFWELKGKVVLDVYSFGIMMKGCCEVGDLMKGFQLLAMLDQMDLSPNVVIYTTLIDGCCKNGDVQLAEVGFNCQSAYL